MIKKPVIMFVEWVDSCGSPGWRSERDIETEPAICQTAGFVVAESKTALTIACSRNTTEGHTPYNDCIAIPKVAIRRKRRLR